MYHLGLIGNCQISALVNQLGSIEWLSLPRPDSEPIFGRLLDPEGGHFAISICGADESDVTGRQYYLENTNILLTELSVKGIPQLRITDFCPRFEQHGRMFRPCSLYRIVEPLTSGVMVRVDVEPVSGWRKKRVPTVRGNSHLRYEIRGDSLRLVTNMPLTLLTENRAVLLKEKLYFGLTWSFGIEEDLVDLVERQFRQTLNYWRMWVKHCSIPAEFQRETIRSALALKLHCYEDTGAILAATTTSLPEEVGAVRNWDYRYCWLRDSFFVLSAFHNLGHFEEMEGYLKFVLNIAGQHSQLGERLAPVYALDHSLPLPEVLHDNWSGFRGSRPVRSANQAAEHIQNDVYGELLLTLAPIFFDERFLHLRTRDVEELLNFLAKRSLEVISQPDAGLWELRDGWQEHTFSNLLSWAGLERMERLGKAGKIRVNDAEAVSRGVLKSAAAVMKGVAGGALRSGPTDASFDTSLCMAAILRFPEKGLLEKTMATMDRELAFSADHGEFYYRYKKADDFGTPKSAFLACSFWMAQAYSGIGNRARAREILTQALKSANTLGLFSEHFDPARNEMLGNFPQAYSHVGLINSVFSVSPSWDDIL